MKESRGKAGLLNTEALPYQRAAAKDRVGEVSRIVGTKQVTVLPEGVRRGLTADVMIAALPIETRPAGAFEAENNGAHFDSDMKPFVVPTGLY